MKKPIVWIIVALIIAVAGGVFAYWYNCVDTVTDYILVKFTPPQEEKSLFGGISYSDPKVECQFLGEYPTDTVAVRDQSKELERTRKFLYQELAKLESEESDDATADIIKQARYKAILSHLSTQRIVVRTTHVRSLNPEEALKIFQEHWGDSKLEEYARDKKIDVAVYPLLNLPD